MTQDAQGAPDAGANNMQAETPQVTVAAPEGEDMEGAPPALSQHAGPSGNAAALPQ